MIKKKAASRIRLLTFVVEMTTFVSCAAFAVCCDLLKIHYLCGRNDNFLFHAQF